MHLSSSIAFLIKRRKIHVKIQKIKYFSFYEMISFYEPLSQNPPLLRWNLNTSQTKEQRRRSDWCEIHTFIRRLIGARYIPQTIWLVQTTYHSLNANVEFFCFFFYCFFFVFFFFITQKGSFAMISQIRGFGYLLVGKQSVYSTKIGELHFVC